jgi:hypothetical protein
MPRPFSVGHAVPLQIGPQFFAGNSASRCALNLCAALGRYVPACPPVADYGLPGLDKVGEQSDATGYCNRSF